MHRATKFKMAAVLKVFEEYFRKIGGECVEIRVDYDRFEQILKPDQTSIFWQQISEFSLKVQELVKENSATFEETKQNQESDEKLMHQCPSTSEMISDNSDQALASSEARAMDPSLVQITATNSEIERRMAAFLKKKQLDVDIHNQREFCNLLNTENEFSCARVDAVFLPRVGQRSHISVTDASREDEIMKTDNITVDTILHSVPAKRQKTESGSNGSLPYGVQERLDNIESHLKTNVKSVHGDVYKRLKQMEEKILYLEGLSPEYFNYKTNRVQNQFQRNRTNRQAQNDNWLFEAESSEMDLDQRMLQLKAKLLNSSKNRPT